MPALSGTQQLPQEKLAEDLDQLDEAMIGLQVLYEKYFLGIDRRPPEAQRRQVSEKMRLWPSALSFTMLLTTPTFPIPERVSEPGASVR